jgi:hypothetical protein
MTMSKATLYDKTGAAFSFDHEHDGKVYVRPMVKMIYQSNYGDDFHEEEDFEPATYLMAMDRAALSDAPPLAVVNEEVAVKQAELDALKAEAKKVVGDLNSQRHAAEREFQSAKLQLERWMETHRVMMDIGKLLDGKILYPLSTKENHYHHGRDIPWIPKMSDLRYLVLDSGNFETGQKWTYQRRGSDYHSYPFCFFDTEEERAALIRSEFDAACQKFREKPNFTVDIYTSTNLHYGTLLEWVKTHPALAIPEDIKAMKVAHDAELVERRKALLAAELAAMEAKATAAE